MEPVLIIACGALARELKAVIAANGWQHVQLHCLPADLHNRPDRIPEAVREQIRASRERFARILVGYADCGTGGLLDRVLEEEGVERLPGAHCYEFYAGTPAFTALADAEPGSFYLTDFLVRHFDRLVIRELGIERHPELASMYFGNYRRLIYLAQAEDAQLHEQARQAAARLGLEFHYRFTGYGGLQTAIVRFHRQQGRDARTEQVSWQS